MNIPVKLIREIPSPGDPGFFGARRKYDIHTGIDLYCEDGAEVTSLFDGVVIAIEDFTGPRAGSKWWEDTQAILVESTHGVVLYGELVPSPGIIVGAAIKKGDLLGNVKRVLKKDKGKTPTSMLHLEYYSSGQKNSVWWHLSDPIPQGLKNPITLLNPKISELSHTYEYKLVYEFYGDKKSPKVKCTVNESY